MAQPQRVQYKEEKTSKACLAKLQANKFSDLKKRENMIVAKLEEIERQSEMIPMISLLPVVGNSSDER